jgi:replicative DNA helicase
MSDTLKTLPNSAEAEAAVLGSILLDCRVVDGLTLLPEHFYDLSNGLIFAEIMNMSTSGKYMDAITIGEHLKESGVLDSIGGYDKLIELQKETIVPSHSRHYESIVLEKHELRRQIGILSRGLEAAYSGESASDSAISELMEVDRVDECSLGSIIECWDRAAKGELQTIPTPYADLDMHTGGIRIGMPTVFTGRSKAGKSMFLAMWYNYLGEKGIPAMVLPFEDGQHITQTRMAASFGNYEWGKIENGGKWTFASGRKEWLKVTEKELEYAKKCLRHVEQFPIHFFDRSIAPRQLTGKVARFKKKHGIKVFFIDGAKDFIKPSGKYNDVGFDEECSQVVKRACKEIGVAGVVVHHLTKMNDSDIITEGNIRGSGNIVSDSRSVYALQSKGLESEGVAVERDDYGRITTRRFDCICNNHGSSGSVLLESDLARCRFSRQDGGDMAQSEGEAGLDGL